MEALRKEAAAMQVALADAPVEAPARSVSPKGKVRPSSAKGKARPTATKTKTQRPAMDVEAADAERPAHAVEEPKS